MGVRRLSQMFLVSLCALASVLAFSGTPALASPSAPVIEHEFASGASTGSVTLVAVVNPEGESTEYHFEYDTSEYLPDGPPHGTSAPSPGVGIGSEAKGKEVILRLQGLAPHSTYHFRVVAQNARGTTDGSDYTVATEALGGTLYLPDGRAWEQVTPVDKHGGLIDPVGIAQSPATQAAASGDAFTYYSSFPTEDKPSADVGGTQVLSTRGAAGGWASSDISSRQSTPIGAHIVAGSFEYLLFSDDLSTGLLEQVGEDAVALSNEAVAGQQGLYVRQQGYCSSESFTGGCFIPLVTSMEGYADVPSGTNFGGGLYFEAATPDMSYVILKSRTPLTPTGAGLDQGVYEWSRDKPRSEQLQLVSRLPTGEAGAVTRTAVSGEHAVSSNGSHVFWMNGGEGPRQGPNNIYMTDLAAKETIRLDVSQPGGSGTSNFYDAIFQSANTEGTRAYFTDTNRLTAQSSKQGTRDLYECAIVTRAGKLNCELTDLTPETNGEPSQVGTMLPGVSEDGSYVYFVADGVLAPGATSGTCNQSAPLTAKCNLYVHHDGTTEFIATLTEQDHSDWSTYEDEVSNLKELTARASPNGRYLAFMSNSPLTGYDNRDAQSGQLDQEVYLYDAVAKRLACVSCVPTGVRPVGVQKVFGANPGLVGFSYSLPSNSWVAATIPTWNGPLLPQNNQEGLYQPRYLSDNGRLFFNSDDPLVPQDIDGTWDVYEYEPPGTGDCTSSSVTFSGISGGCVDLISAGTSASDSEFVDASATGGRTPEGAEGGGDTFFMTAEKLLSQDTDSAYDVYDAHECSAEFPCASPPASPPECTTADACRTAPLVQPSIFGSPASATFSGAGDVTPSVSVSPVGKKVLTRAQKLARTLSACRKKRSAKRRVSCERKARKQYGAVKSRKANATKGVR